MAVAPTLIGIFLETVRAQPRADQFMRKTATGWEQISSDRALADVESLALALRGLGIVRGQQVALLSENRYEWPLTDLAVLGLGAVTVPIYPTLLPQQVRHILANSEARAAIVSTQAQLEKVRAIQSELPNLEVIVVMDPSGTPAAKEHSFAALLERGKALRRDAPNAFKDSAAEVRPDDVATIIYTSGTTGDPKGAVLTHANIASNVAAALQVVNIGGGDRCLSFLPLCHIFERMAGLYAMLGGGAGIAYAESIDTVAANAMEVKPTILCGVPRFFEKVYARVMDNALSQPPARRAIFFWGLRVRTEAVRARFAGEQVSAWTALQARIADRLVGAKVRARVGGRVKLCISGGAPLAPKVMEFFFAIGIPVCEGYGLTETSPVITLNPPGREKPGAVGVPLPGVEVRIGENGEVLTRGPHVMKGYFKNPEATNAVLSGGWFHTGDVGKIDEQGYLAITDRIKDLLVTAGGKKVAPQPIEARLKTSKWISEAVLLGDARPYVVCLIVPNFPNLQSEMKSRALAFANTEDLLRLPETRALYQAEIEAANQGLASFESIKHFALLPRELSQEQGDLTPTLKVKRRVIAEKFAALIEGLYAASAPVRV